MIHLADRDLKGFLENRLTPRARRRVVHHLLGGCDGCAARLRAVIPPDGLWSTSTPEDEEVYDACIDRAFEAATLAAGLLATERERRDRGLEMVQAKGWRNLTSGEQRSCRGRWSQVEILLELSFATRFRDRHAMLRLALSAQREAARLTPTMALDAELLADLRARTAAEVANAERVNEHFSLAEAALQEARAFLEQGTGDLLVQARIDEVEASLRSIEGRFEEAEVLLDQAHRAYLSLGERHLAGRVLVSRGLFYSLAGRPEEAIVILRGAAPLLDPARDPQLPAIATQCLINSLVDAGAIEEAEQLLVESDLRQVFAREPLSLLRLRWLEGKILAGTGWLEEAEEVLREVRDRFRAHGLELPAAVAGLDLAKIALLQGSLDHTYEISCELARRAEERGLPRSAQCALHAFRSMCETRIVQIVNAERVQRFLHQLEHHAALAWEPTLLHFG
jgi:tetratricopeptide (TPR) repeat protein